MKSSTKNISLYTLMVLTVISFATLSLTGCGGNNTGYGGTGRVTFIDNLPTLTQGQTWRLYVVPKSATEIDTTTLPVATGLSSSVNPINRSVSLRKVITGDIGLNQYAGDWNETGDYNVVITIVENSTIITWKVLLNVEFTNGNASVALSDFIDQD